MSYYSNYSTLLCHFCPPLPVYTHSTETTFKKLIILSPTPPMRNNINHATKIAQLLNFFSEIPEGRMENIRREK